MSKQCVEVSNLRIPRSSTPHHFRPRTANAAALFEHELAAISTAGALDADSRGSYAPAE